MVVPALRDKPDLPEELLICYHIYHDLAGDRALGFSVGPVPWTAVKEWCYAHCITDPDSLDELWEIVSRADARVLKKIGKNSSSSATLGANQNATPGNGRDREVPGKLR